MKHFVSTKWISIISHLKTQYHWWHMYLCYGWRPKLELLPVQRGTSPCTWDLFLMLLWRKNRNFGHIYVSLGPDPSWSGLPFSSPGDLPNPGVEPGCLALPADSLLSEPPGRLQSLPRKPVILSYGTCGSSGSLVDRQLFKVDSLDEPLVTLPSLSHSWVVGVCVVLCVWDDQMTGLRVIVNMYGWEDHTN